MRRPRGARRGVLLAKGDVLSPAGAPLPAGAPSAHPPGPAPSIATDHRESSAGIARNAFFLVIGQIVTTALAIVTNAALGRYLGAVDFGRYYLMLALSTFAYVFVEWGQALFVVRQVAIAPARSGELLGAALGLRAAFALVVIVPAGLVSLALGYGGYTTLLSVLLILATLPMFLAQGYGMAFRAHDRMSRDAVVSVTGKAAALCVAVPALALGAGIPGVFLALAVGGGTAVTVAAWLYGRMGLPAVRFSPAVARELLIGGLPIVAMTAAISAQPYIDAVILSKLAPASAVGWFGAAKGILGTLMAPAVILGAAAYPRMSRASADVDALRREVRAALRPLLWLAALAGAGTYLFASTAIAVVYGRAGFAPAATILQVFAPGLFLLFVDILLGNVVYASGGANGFAVAKIASVAVGSGLDLLLIPHFQERTGNGGVGVVVAFALSEVVVFAGALLVMRPGTLQSAAFLDMLRAVASAAATILLLRALPALPAWAGIPLCIAAFTAISLALGLVRWAELAALAELALRRGADGPVQPPGA